MGGWRKELVLEIKAGPPSEHAAHVQSFPFNLAKHVRGRNTFGRSGVMRAPCGMNVMVATVVAEIHRVNPALKRHVNPCVVAGRNLNLGLTYSIFRTSARLHSELAGRQHDR